MSNNLVRATYFKIP